MRPDILLLVLDTQRADRLSCYAGPSGISPHLDGFAAKGARFTHVITPSPWTLPAHASLFTGVYPSQHGLVQMDGVLPENLPTLAERLRNAGYATAGFSNNPLVGLLDNGLTRGFDCFWNYGGLLTPKPRPTSCSARLASLATYLRKLQRTIANSPNRHRILFSRWGLLLWHTALQLKGNLKGSSEEALAETAQLLIGRSGLTPHQPVFCFVNLMGTHFPFDPPVWSRARFAPQANVTLRAFLARRWFNAQLYYDMGPLPDTLSGERECLINELYNAEVAAQDRLVGELLEHLYTANRFTQTLVIITSDHGEHLGEHRLLGHGFGVHEALASVPLLICGEPFASGVTVTDCVSTRRLFHTILSAAGAAMGQEATLSLTHTDAESLVLIEAPPVKAVMANVEQRRPGLLGHSGYHRLHRAVYAENHKLVVAGDDIALYAVEDDPLEQYNLAFLHPAEARKLHAYFHEITKSIVVSPSATENTMLNQRLRGLGYM